MTIEYFLDQNDCLELQLYLASKSEIIKKKRTKSKISIPILYIVCSCVLYLLNLKVLAISFVVIAVLWFFVYPLWLNSHYVTHYRDFIKEKWTESSAKLTIIKFDDENLHVKSDSGESRLNITEIGEISETPKLILLKLKSGNNIILPKTKISNVDLLKGYLKIMALKLKVNYSDENHWAWK